MDYPAVVIIVVLYLVNRFGGHMYPRNKPSGGIGGRQMDFLEEMYAKLGDYLTAGEMALVHSLLIVGVAAATFYPLKYVIDLIFPW